MLEEFGLTKTEEKIYLELAKIGASPASDLIKKTQLHRTTVYDVLERLIAKGLVSYVTKDKIKIYSATDPSKFLDIALEEKINAEKKEKLAKKIINKIKVEIKLNKKENKTSPIARVFIGKQGQKTIMNDIVNECKEFFVLGSGGTFNEEMPLYTEQWADQRKKKNIKAKIIAVKGYPVPKWRLNKIKFISKKYEPPTSTIVYKNKVAFFIQEKPIQIIVIESEKLAKDYKTYFNLLWKIAQP